MSEMIAESVFIGDRRIGEVDPCFIIAEIGLNHNGSLELAKQSITLAAQSGADAVKFQNFLTEDFLTDKSVMYSYRSQGREITEPLWDICKRNEFKKEWIIPLKNLSDDLGVVFMSTPTSEIGVSDLMNAGVQALKNGSDYITHLPLLKFMGDTGVPVIISTGMADQNDIDDAVAAATSAKNSGVVLLHCISNYPTTPENVNLSRMASLRKRYGVPVGFSDHTQGWVAAVQAVTLGACVIEKHFTADRDLPGPDHWFSTTPNELKTLVEEVRNAEQRFGKPEISPGTSEMETKDEYRVGLVASRDLKAGETMTEDRIAVRKPGRGLLPKDLNRCLGQRLNQDLASGEPIQQHHLG